MENNNGKIVVLEYINSTLKRKLWEFQTSDVDISSEREYLKSHINIIKIYLLIDYEKKIDKYLKLNFYQIFC